MDQHAETGFGKRFFVHLAGKTNGAHLSLIEKFNGVGHFEVSSLDESDYLLAFCPLFSPSLSQLEDNICEALEGIPGGRPVILVVMFQAQPHLGTFVKARQKMSIPNVSLCVDCLFYEGKLVNCAINNMAWFHIMKYLGLPLSTIWNIRSWYWDHWKLVVFLCFLMIMVFMVLLICIPVLQSSSFKL